MVRRDLCESKEQLGGSPASLEGQSQSKEGQIESISLEEMGLVPMEDPA